MMETNLPVSEDTKATLLLCGTLGKDNAAVHPLTLPQYNALVQTLVSLGKRPSDLLHDGGLVEAVGSMPMENARLKEPASPGRLEALLNRGFALSMALNRWAQYGVRPVGRGDGLYPARMKRYLKGKSPAVLYYVGNSDLFAGGGMAFVGSRNISGEASEAIRRIVRECVDAGMPIVSGGARGADQTSMREAFGRGGRVIGALPGDLLKSCLAHENREAIGTDNVLLFSAVDPEERFTPIIVMATDNEGIPNAGGRLSTAAENTAREDTRPPSNGTRINPCQHNKKANDVALKVSPVRQPLLFDYAEEASKSGRDTLRNVSEPIAPYIAEKEVDIYSALISVVVAALAQKSHTETALRKVVDPEGYLSSKGWKMFIEKACAEGKIVCREKAKKRGKLGTCYFLS